MTETGCQAKGESDRRPQAQARARPGSAQLQPPTPPHLTPRQSLTWRPFVVVQHVFPSLDVTVDGGTHFIRGDVFSHDAARNLARGVDPFDDPARATPRLADGRRHAATADLHGTLGHCFVRLFQGAILFRSRGMADLTSLGNTSVAWVTSNTRLFTEHYAAPAAKMLRKRRLL
jgi:hypothetical protein